MMPVYHVLAQSDNTPTKFNSIPYSKKLAGLSCPLEFDGSLLFE
jgi:hypothetical protein